MGGGQRESHSVTIFYSKQGDVIDFPLGGEKWKLVRCVNRGQWGAAAVSRGREMLGAEHIFF